MVDFIIITIVVIVSAAFLIWLGANLENTDG